MLIISEVFQKYVEVVCITLCIGELMQVCFITCTHVTNFCIGFFRALFSASKLCLEIRPPPSLFLREYFHEHFHLMLPALVYFKHKGRNPSIFLFMPSSCHQTMASIY